LSTKYTDALVEALRLMKIVLELKKGTEQEDQSNIQDWGLLPEDEDDLFLTLETMLHRVYDPESMRAALLAVFLLGIQSSFEGHLQPPYHLDRIN